MVPIGGIEGNDYVVVRVSIIPQLLLASVVVSASLLGILLLFFVSKQITSAILGVILLFFGVIFILFIILRIIMMIHEVQNMYYLLGNGAIRLVKNNIFSKDDTFYTVNENADFILSQSFLGRIFRYGTIEVNDPTGRLKMMMLNVAHPQKTMNDLIKLLATIKDKQVVMVEDPDVPQETIL